MVNRTLFSMWSDSFPNVVTFYIWLVIIFLNIIPESLEKQVDNLRGEVNRLKMEKLELLKQNVVSNDTFMRYFT